MSNDRKSRILHMIDGAWNNGDLAALDAVTSVDCIRHRPPFRDIEGLQAMKEYIASVRLNYPDFHLAVDDLVIEGDVVVTRWTWTGTHSGPSGDLPIPPTGRTVKVSGCSVDHVQNGLAVEQWSFADNLGLLQQLGLVPKMS